MNIVRETVPEAESLQNTMIKKHGKSVISLRGITNILKDISHIQNELSRVRIVLFNSEPDMTLYAGGSSPFLKNLRQIKVVENIGEMQVIKNRLSNGTHAIIAWYSSLLGYKTIGQGMGDERILNYVNQLMEEEIKPMLIHSSPEYENYMEEFMKNFIKRCRFSFKDPVTRVGRDPIRKLQYNERVLGTLSMANTYGTQTPLLELGAAMGFFYGISLVNPKDKESILLHNLYKKTGRIEDVLTYQGTVEGKKCRFLDKEKDMETVKRISNHFKQLAKGTAISPA